MSLNQQRYNSVQERIMAEYERDNTYWKHKRVFWFHKSAASGKRIWPLDKVWLKGLRLPGTWQDDRHEWFTEKEYTFLFLKGKVNG